MFDYSQLSAALIEGNWESTRELARAAVDAGANPQDVIYQALQPGMDIVGERYSSGEYFLPDLLKAARSMNAALEIVRPLIKNEEMLKAGKIVIGTVKGDMHDIGKNIVALFLNGVGFEVLDLGTNVSDQRFVDEVRKSKPHILGLSALLTTTMYKFGDVIQLLTKEDLRSQVKVIVGGATITAEFAKRMGADAYARDGGEAIKVCKQLLLT